MKKTVDLDEFSNVEDLHPNGASTPDWEGEAEVEMLEGGAAVIRIDWRSLLNHINSDSRNGEKLATEDAADLEMIGVEWLWPGRFARGKFGLISGLPDMGKGQIAAFIAAAVTAGLTLPRGE